MNINVIILVLSITLVVISIILWIFITAVLTQLEDVKKRLTQAIEYLMKR